MLVRDVPIALLTVEILDTKELSLLCYNNRDFTFFYFIKFI